MDAIASGGDRRSTKLKRLVVGGKGDVGWIMNKYTKSAAGGG
jgi:hypothetical protein